MSRERRRELFEVIGLLAVVGSLLFLALEIRHSSTVASAQTINEIYDAVREIDLATFADPELTRITATTTAGLSDLNDSERRQYEQYVILMIEVWDRAIERENEGLIVSSSFATWHDYYESFIERHVTREMWEEIRWNWGNKELNERVDAVFANQGALN